MTRYCVLALVACSSTPSPPPEPHAADARRPAPTVPSPDTRRWFSGDVHMHCSPPDDPNDVSLGVDQIAERARAQHMDFVVLTPHVWPGRRGPAFDDEWRAMAKAARATRAPTLIPGIEWTTRSGHFTVAGTDVPALGNDLLASAHAAGAFVSVNHPYAVPTRLPGIGASHYDMSYRAWTAGGSSEPIDGVEVFNLPLALANIISKPGGETGETRAWASADRLARSEHRRITAVGGTDNHQLTVLATTWVLAIEATENAILDALRLGATCVGGPEAGSFKAKADHDWVRIGGIVEAPRSITLAWDGAARLFVDGVDTGEHTGGYVHATLGVPHTYRIVAGGSRSGFIYANL